MAVLLPRSLFLHNRKTGGMWIRAVLEGIDHTRVLRHPDAQSLSDAPHAILHMGIEQARRALKGERRFIFTFVRHPFSWLESYFAHRVRRGWPVGSFPHDSFEQWVMATPSRWIDEQFALFTGAPARAADFVGHYENLKGDLETALVRAGESFEPGIFAVPPKNVADHASLSLCSWTQPMRDAVTHRNPQAFARYGYRPDDVLDGHLFGHGAGI